MDNFIGFSPFFISWCVLTEADSRHRRAFVFLQRTLGSVSAVDSASLQSSPSGIDSLAGRTPFADQPLLSHDLGIQRRKRQERQEGKKEWSSGASGFSSKGLRNSVVLVRRQKHV